MLPPFCIYVALFSNTKQTQEFFPLLSVGLDVLQRIPVIN